MARIIMKSPYLKPNAVKHLANYAQYIATRDGVEKPSDSKRFSAATVQQKQVIAELVKMYPDSKELYEYEDYQKNPTRENADEYILRVSESHGELLGGREKYVDYIATRPRVEKIADHGLFTDAGIPVILEQAAREVSEHTGNVWTHIISLRREDAARLGYDSVEQWQALLRSQRNLIAEQMKIAPENFRWYAAFHNESHHPHVHMMAFSVKPDEPYLTEKGIRTIKANLAKEIFRQDLISIYEKQTESRNMLRQSSAEHIAEIVGKINDGGYDNPQAEQMLTQLADKLSQTSGKKQYGYLKSDVKDMVNAIVDMLAEDERIAKLYDLWYEQKFETIRTYTDTMPDKLPLSQNPDFKTIRNAVVNEAMNIVLGRQTFEDVPESDITEPEITEPFSVPAEEPIEQDTPYSGFNRNGKPNDSWWSDDYKKARHFLYGSKTEKPDFAKAMILMKAEAENGNGFAMHDIGKMLLVGMGCAEDDKTAQEWFAKAYSAFVNKEAISRQKDYLQYRIGKLYSFGYGVEQNYEKAAEWYEKAVLKNNSFVAYSLGSLYRRGQGVEQNDERAFELYMQAANHEKKPNAYAQYELGRMFADGIGREKNQSSSEQWYKLAYNGFLKIVADMPDEKLYYRIGQMNRNGIGTEVNLERAKEYFEKAAKLGNADALYGLGKLYMNKEFSAFNVQTAMMNLKAAAEKNHAFAEYTLGRLFYRGEQVPQNLSYAVAMLEKAALQENEPAEYLLGKILLQPDTEYADVARAEKLLTKAAEAGNEYAAYTLGKAYLDGVLLPQDIAKAIALLTQAANKDFAPAQYTLGKIFFQGEVIPQDIPKAIALLERAAGQGNSYAAYLAGKIRLTEDSVKDVDKAISHFLFAAANGNDFAEYQLGKLFLFGKDAERDYNRAISYLTAAAEHGNPYAAQLLHSIRSNRNCAAATGVIRLFHHMSRVLQDRLEDNRRGKPGMIDRKLKRMIDEKKQAHGQKLE